MTRDPKTAPIDLAKTNGTSPPLIIDPILQSLIAPLTPQEFDLLKTQIVEQGCLTPLCIWKTEDNRRVILDGHNRYKICTENNISFTTVKTPIESLEHAKLWVLEHQAGRRNLTDDQRTIVWNDIREQRSIVVQGDKMRKAREVKAGTATVTPISVNPAKIDTRAAVVKESGLPVSGFRRAQQLKKHNPTVYDKVRTGVVKLRDTASLLKKPPKVVNVGNDFFRHLGHLIDGVFKGTIKDRLNTLMKTRNITQSQVVSAKIIAAALDELSRTAKEYSVKLNKFARVA